MNGVTDVQACYWKGEAGGPGSFITKILPSVLASRGSINQWLYRHFIQSVLKICSVGGLITAFPLLMLSLLMTCKIL